MATSTAVGRGIDILVASLVPENTVPERLRKLTDIFKRGLKHHSYGRTNQFDVAQRLDGLQEGLQVLDRDDLADALHSRLTELKACDEVWLPDVLDVLLRLSDQPASKSKLEKLETLCRVKQDSSPLRWTDIEVDDPFDRKDQIWQSPTFSALSSDDEILSISSEASFLSVLEQSSTDNGVARKQFERAFVNLPPEAKQTPTLFVDYVTKIGLNNKEAIFITELQAVRETLFMLHGLPTSLFSSRGVGVAVETRFQILDTGPQGCHELLSSFAAIGSEVSIVRAFARKSQTVPFMQALCDGIKQYLMRLDSAVTSTESRLLTPKGDVLVTLIGLLLEVKTMTTTVRELTRSVLQIEDRQLSPIQSLELLFGLVGESQAIRSDECYRSMQCLFQMVLAVYFKPIMRWMNEGELDIEHGSCLIRAKSSSLANLWKDWFFLEEASPSTATPNFLRPVLPLILKIGKTQVFLRRLQVGGDETFLTQPSSLRLSDLGIFPSELVPFPELFIASLKQVFDSHSRHVSTTLKQKLDQDCELWGTLDALHYIFLGKNGVLNDAMETKIFERIDRANNAWSDRYLVRELLQKALARVTSINTESILVRSARRPSRDMKHRRLSVNIFADLSIDYVLPWSIANIIPKTSIEQYRRVSIFLIQIRRARYSLERRGRFHVDLIANGMHRGMKSLALSLLHKLLLFTNTLYAHLTQWSIEGLTDDMRSSLARAPDMDAMIMVHKAYLSSLEDECLTSNHLSPIREAIISILDICIRFVHIVSFLRGGQSVKVETHASATTARRRRLHNRLPIDEGESSSDDDISAAEGHSTFGTFDEASYSESLQSMQHDFERQYAFVVAGLTGVSRTGPQLRTWRSLARKLDSKSGRGVGS